MSAYLTVARDATTEIEVKQSRFRCHLVRVEDEEAARAVIDAARRKHRDARHHCSAMVLGSDRSVERSSDDGEPGGTAGAPMLEVLRGAHVTDVAAVVTRWFGGTLLGAGGLVRAYSESVRSALDEAGLVERRLLRELLLDVEHAIAGRVESDLRDRGAAVLDATYGEMVTLRLGVRPVDEPALHSLVAELTSGTAQAVLVGERWVDS